jgi:hypothetical protein
MVRLVLAACWPADDYLRAVTGSHDFSNERSRTVRKHHAAGDAHAAVCPGAVRRLIGGSSFILHLPTSDRWLAGFLCTDNYAVMGLPRMLERHHVDRGFRSVDGGGYRRVR